MAVVLGIKNMDKVLELLRWYEERNDRNALLFRMGISTALRVGDLLDIQFHDIFKNFNGGQQFREHLQIKERKTGKIRKVILNNHIRPHISRYCKFYEMEGEDYLFFSPQNPTTHMHRITAWRALKKGAEACGIEHFGTHTMRKTAGFHIYYNSGEDIALTMALLNHTSPKQTLIYIGVVQKEVDAALMEFGIEFERVK